jgi:signal transduction histidine kinase
MFGALTWIVSWQGANAPLAFDIGVLAEAPFFVLTFYLFLAFPMGRLEPPAARWLMAVLVIGVLAFFLPWALFTPVIAGGGPLTGCAAGCPANALQIGTAPTVVEIAGKAETYTALAVTLAVLVVYVRRWFSASRPQRRALAAVAVTSLLFMPAYFASNLASQILKLAPATLDVLAWCIVCTRVLLPLGFLVALLQADRFAGAALREMLERLATRPTPHEWRETVAEALDDPDLRLGYHDPRAGRFREPSGDELVPPPPATGRAWVPIDQAAEPVAAMVIDGALAEDPELVRAAGTATLVAVANGALEGALQASLQREATAGHAERVRLERDIHDSAQQRLVALRVHLGLAGERLDRSEDRALLESLNDEVERAIEELRGVTHGSAPPRLREGGLRAALLAAGARSPMRVRLHADGLTRHPEAIETTVYFCCLECLQNVARHAGPGASATVRLTDGDGRLRFVVEDDGVGFDPEHVQRGAGLRNLAERIDAGGGTLRIESRPGQGTRITGDLPQRS